MTMGEKMRTVLQSHRCSRIFLSKTPRALRFEGVVLCRYGVFHLILEELNDEYYDELHEWLRKYLKNDELAQRIFIERKYDLLSSFLAHNFLELKDKVRRYERKFIVRGENIWQR